MKLLKTKSNNTFEYFDKLLLVFEENFELLDGINFFVYAKTIKDTVVLNKYSTVGEFVLFFIKI